MPQGNGVNTIEPGTWTVVFTNNGSQRASDVVAVAEGAMYEDWWLYSERVKCPMEDWNLVYP